MLTMKKSFSAFTQILPSLRQAHPALLAQQIAPFAPPDTAFWHFLLPLSLVLALFPSLLLTSPPARLPPLGRGAPGGLVPCHCSTLWVSAVAGRAAEGPSGTPKPEQCPVRPGRPCVRPCGVPATSIRLGAPPAAGHTPADLAPAGCVPAVHAQLAWCQLSPCQLAHGPLRPCCAVPWRQPPLCPVGVRCWGSVQVGESALQACAGEEGRVGGAAQPQGRKRWCTQS